MTLVERVTDTIGEELYVVDGDIDAVARDVIRATLEEARRAVLLHLSHPAVKDMVNNVHGLMLRRFERGEPLAPEGPCDETPGSNT